MEHLRVGKYLLCGASWGSTLSLAHGEQYPERVSGMLLASVTSTRRAELDRHTHVSIIGHVEEMREDVHLANIDRLARPGMSRRPGPPGFRCSRTGRCRR
jgi:pimeloyl-ACP methyl ester carboxylesterase